jgi:hypothetical protein
LPVIDPSLVDISKTVAIDRTTKNDGKIWRSGRQDLMRCLNKLEEQDYNPKFSKDAMNYAFALMVGFTFRGNRCGHISPHQQRQ